MQVKVVKTVESDQFQFFILGVILFATILVGLENFPNFVAKYHGILHIFDSIIIWIFIGELILKIMAEVHKHWRYLLMVEISLISK
ncbi:MAG: hypothetical protein F6K10_00230 [Moorea sp. SIO2B7]|nr:hypothetical protein [Moorena sp. SIO2B7]